VFAIASAVVYTNRLNDYILAKLEQEQGSSNHKEKI